jgi:hypothetical protein
MASHRVQGAGRAGGAAHCHLAKAEGNGCAYLQNGVYILPRSDDHEQRLKLLQYEVAEGSGEALILATVGFDKVQDEKVLTRFKADRDDAYEEFIDKCDDFEREIAKETAVADCQGSLICSAATRQDFRLLHIRVDPTLLPGCSSYISSCLGCPLFATGTEAHGKQRIHYCSEAQQSMGKLFLSLINRPRRWALFLADSTGVTADTRIGMYITMATGVVVVVCIWQAAAFAAAAIQRALPSEGAVDPRA